MEKPFVEPFDISKPVINVPNCTPNLNGIEFRTVAIGSPPYLETKPNGEYAGFEVDTIRIMVDKVGAKLRVDPAADWLNVLKDENGTDILDENGNNILIGTTPELLYGRATFAVAEHYLLYETAGYCDYLINTQMKLHYQSGKPQVSHA